MPGPRRASPPAAGASRDRTYTISDLAAEFALTPRAIRFYEDEGLLEPRRDGQSRVYGERERTRTKLILRGKRLGLSLVEIREILDLHDRRDGDRRQLERFLEALEARRRALAVQREDIDVLLAEIASIERDCRRRLRSAAGSRERPARAARAATPGADD